ncbi:N-acetyltransferase [Cryobacterium sp. N21]|uniref:GNAT family N-acetyltransferase n=1 Tax=Cryobacterium sp. N21 TaxID=2048289 RepID=UPI000CE3CBEE|nr:GNAT family N-acetyltransferase [Cryobacterium sp. N21]
MGLAEYQNSEITRKPSLSETTRFGFSTDRTTVGLFAASSRPDRELVEAAQRVLDGTAASINILRYPSELVSLLRDLRTDGMSVFPGGSILYWEGPAHSHAGPEPDTRELVGPDRIEFAQKIETVLEDSFHGYVNHYSANPLLPPGIVVAGYADWAKSTMARTGNKVFVVLSDLRIVGVAVIGVVGTIWEIELASVASASQGKGKYLKLIRAVLSSAHSAGATRVVISTQSHNIAVQRAWVKLGFQPVTSIETVHLVDTKALGRE